MEETPLFIATPTGRCRLSLRRFRFQDGAGGHRHDATVVIGEDEPVTPRTPDGTVPVTDRRVPRDDPRWPALCACGERFREDDEWQVNELDWYEGAGQRFAWGIGSWAGPPGAMIRAAWRDDPDGGQAWIVVLPNGSWWCTLDWSSGDGNKPGPRWTVTGTAPAITVSPSINDTSSRPWHGWIQNGIMRRA